MVTGEAVVLYWRLHLVVLDVSKVRWVRRMIIVNICILHVPMPVLFLGLNSGDERFARPAAIYNRIQKIGLCIQDLVICGTQLHGVVRALKSITRTRGRKGRSVIIHLLWVSVLVVLNIPLFTEYHLQYVQLSFRTVVCSIKLKLEFAVVDRLCPLMHSHPLVFPQGPMQQCWLSRGMNYLNLGLKAHPLYRT